jgi:hypothetical protein
MLSLQLAQRSSIIEPCVWQVRLIKETCSRAMESKTKERSHNSLQHLLLWEGGVGAILRHRLI